MLTIVKVSKGRGNYYNIEVSNGEKVRVSEDTLIDFRLLKDQEIDQETLTEIKNASRQDIGFQLALNYLSYQLRTEMEIRKYLKDNEIPKEDRHLIVQRLVEMNLLDDENFAESYVRTQMRLGDKGPKILAQKLKQKGISNQLVETTLAKISLSDQQDLALQVANKALKKYRGKSSRETTTKIFQYLLQKGFSGDVIDFAIAELDFSDVIEQESEALINQGEKLWRSNQRFELSKRKQKVKQSLYQKGFQLDQIDTFIREKEDAETSE
ncbi:recombination regulator RecX [Enterococcus alishanensis]|uniref:Regulatory protein RecX n=1 Tax=Enterococcus alishanensis TaxID=1303817 RepID=A0ABS6TAF6_9ENTE|nr:recombination regulator RecX [Enterococcus alishanensis]MBV7389884.1 recombination regulator RecX [Enterococcus alishanensis]